MVVAMSTDHPFVVRSAGSKCSRPPNLPEAWGKVGLRHRDCTGGSTVAAVSSNANMSVLRAEQEGIDFLKRRLASAILRGDDQPPCVSRGSWTGRSTGRLPGAAIMTSD